MTVSFNLSQLANSVNSSGLLSLGTGVTSTLPVANGGTASSPLHPLVQSKSLRLVAD